MPSIRHRIIKVDNLRLALREAGDAMTPTVVLLPGFPSASRAYVRLIDHLARELHPVAIDYPGFGVSDPLTQKPTYDGLAEITARAIDALGIGDYALYLFGHGAPVGMRVALLHDERVQALISQNGTVYEEGNGPGLQVLRDWWADRKAGQAAVDRFTGRSGIEEHWTAGARDQRCIDPELAIADRRDIERTGRTQYMQDLLWDAQTNGARRGAWQQWLRRRRPKVLAAWGKNDPFYVPAGAEAFRHDVPHAEIHLFDTGHFALEEALDPIAQLTAATVHEAFLDTQLD